MNLAEFIMFSRSMKILVMCIGMSAFLIWWVYFGNPGKLVNETQVNGEILSTTKLGYVVQLEDGRRVQLVSSPGLQAGMKVIVLDRAFESGHQELVLSIEQQFAQ